MTTRKKYSEHFKINFQIDLQRMRVNISSLPVATNVREKAQFLLFQFELVFVHVGQVEGYDDLLVVLGPFGGRKAAVG